MKKVLSIITIVAAIVSGSMVGSTLQTNTAHAAVAPSPEELNTARALILQETNQARASVGLPPLVVNNTITTIAQDCSVTQANNFNMAHCTGFSNRYPAGWQWAAENVASGYSYQQVTRAWLNSPGHYANIMNAQATDIGIGMYYDDNGTPYYTQNFAYYPSTATIPGKSTTISASSGATVGSADVTWNIPTGDGRSPITRYELQASAPGQATVNVNVTPVAGATQNHTITGLVGGNIYQFRVRAVNSIGAGAWSDIAQLAVTGVPTVTITNVQPQNDGGVITWSTANNGSTVQSYRIDFTSRPSVTLPANATNYTITGVTPGSNITGNLVAVSNYGPSAPAAFSLTAPAIAPEGPAAISGVVTNKTEIKVTWEESFDGGSPITGYTVELLQGSNVVGTQALDAEAREHTFGGVTRGQTYQFRVYATNAIGSTPSSVGSLAVPVTAPTAVQNANAELVDERKITLTWDAPADNGGVAINNTEIIVYANGTAAQTVTTKGTTYTFDSSVIQPNTTYTFKLSATNANSLVGPAVFTNAIAVPATPTAPAPVQNPVADNVTSDSFRITWEAPTSNGGKAITGYTWTVTTPQGDVVDNGTTTDLNATVTGLTRYTDYTFNVVATNSVGSSTPVGNTVKTLATLPSAPYVVEAYPENATSVVVVVASLDNGGDAKLAYNVTLRLNGQTVGNVQTDSSGRAVFNNVNVNTTYTITATAVNSAGSSVEGMGVVASTQTATAVQNLNVNTSATELSVTWDAPANAGTYPINGYAVSINDADGNTVANQQVTGTANRAVAFPLNATSEVKPNTAYTVVVIPYTHRTNIPGEITTQNVTTPVVAPSAPSNVAVTRENANGSFAVTWNAPAFNGGEEITQYVVTLRNTVNGQTQTVKRISTKATFGGLTHSTNYVVTVQAQNNAGISVGAVNAFNTGAFVPGQPSATHTITGNVVDVTFVPNSNNGGTALAGYSYRVFNVTTNEYVEGEWWIETPASFAAFEGEYGHAYRIEVAARNVMGNSAPFTFTVEIPVTVPGKAANFETTNVTATEVTLGWVAPSFTGGAEITAYEIVLRDSEGVEIDTFRATGTEYTISDLNPYTRYTVEMRAVNSAGQGAKTETNFRTILSAAGQPQNVDAKLASANATSAIVTWDAPANVPAEATGMLRYTVEYVNTVTGKKSSVNNLSTNNAVLSQLARGATYEITVFAHYGTAETLSAGVKANNITPVIVAPNNVTNIQTTWNNLTPTFAWVAPTDNGGATVTYVATLRQGTTVVDTYTGEANTFVAKTLEPDTTYTLTVVATNSAGNSSGATQEFETGRVAPSVPRNVKATVDVATATITVTYDAPAQPGGGTTLYTFTLYNEKGEQQATGNSPVFNNVPRGQNYYVSVVASNTAGSSDAVNTAQVFVSPVAPSAPENVKVAPVGNGTTNLNVTWTAPANNGGAAVEEYTVKVYENTNVVATVKSNTLSATVTGLNPNVQYRVTVTADNGYGETTSAATNITTPVIVASAPRNVTATVDQETALLTGSFDAVANNGGEAVTYTATVVKADGKVHWTGTVTAGEFELFVPRGQTYTVNVVAVNSAGTSVAATSEPVAVDAEAPASVTNIKAVVAADNATTITWDAPTYDGGAPVTSYTWVVLADGKEVAKGNSASPVAEITTLAPNTTYDVRVTAVNSAGSSAPLTVGSLFTTNVLPVDFTVTSENVTSNSFGYVVDVVSLGGVDETQVAYVVQLQDVDGNVLEEVNTLTGEFKNLTHATNYRVAVVATNSAGDATRTLDVKTNAIVATAPTDVVAKVASQTSATVTWEAPADNGGAEVTSYTVSYRNATNTISGEVANVKGTSVTVKDLALGETFTFTVTATNSAGESEASELSNAIDTAPATAPVTLTTEALLELIKNGDLFKFIVNLIQGWLTVDIGDAYNGQWVYGVAHSEPTALGWAYVENGEVAFDVSGLPVGQHNIALYDVNGQLLGYAPFEIAAAATPAPGAETGTESNADGSTTTTENLARTGGEFNWPLWSSLAVFFFAAGSLLIIGRRKEPVAVKVDNN